MTTPLHVGIVGCSAEGAALCYRTLVAMGNERLGGHAHPAISMHTPSLQAYVDCLDRGDVQGVAGLMLESARRLQAAGADFLVCPDNTIHQAMHLVRPASPLPWLHIAEVVADEAARRGFRRLGLTGTAWLVKSDVYPQALAARGIQCIRPGDEVRDRMGRLIMDELVRGVFNDGTTRWFQSVVEGLRAQGCDAVALGCTEIPLILGDHNSALPTLDSTRLLAAAALARALAH